MKLLRQSMQVTTSALTVSVLCAHLLIVGLCAAAPSLEPVSSSATSVVHITTSLSHDALAARSHTASLTLHQNARRTDSFAAALVNPPVCPALAQSRTHTIPVPAARCSASLLPAASRAPPSLVA